MVSSINKVCQWHSFTAFPIGWRCSSSMCACSCGTVALMVLRQFFWYLRTIGLQISPYQKLSKVCGENPVHLFCKLLSWKKGPRTIKHICIVLLDIYLHSSILTYLLIIISSSLLLFLTSPAYFVSHLATPVVSFLRSHDFSNYNPIYL
jgi:hypothetical protein